MPPKTIGSNPTVSLKSTVKVRQVMHWQEYTEEEAAACWYSSDEKAAIVADVRFVLKLMEGGVEAQSHSICTRGLECLTTEGRAERKLSREDTVAAVLSEQKVQRDGGVPDPDLIARVCAETTRRSEEVSREIGRADERWVRRRKHKREGATSPTRKGREAKTRARTSHKRPFKLRRLTSSAA